MVTKRDGVLGSNSAFLETNPRLCHSRNLTPSAASIFPDQSQQATPPPYEKSYTSRDLHLSQHHAFASITCKIWLWNSVMMMFVTWTETFLTRNLQLVRGKKRRLLLDNKRAKNRQDLCPLKIPRRIAFVEENMECRVTYAKRRACKMLGCNVARGVGYVIESRISGYKIDCRSRSIAA